MSDRRALPVVGPVVARAAARALLRVAALVVVVVVAGCGPLLLSDDLFPDAGARFDPPASDAGVDGGDEDAGVDDGGVGDDAGVDGGGDAGDDGGTPGCRCAHLELISSTPAPCPDAVVDESAADHGACPVYTSLAAALVAHDVVAVAGRAAPYVLEAPVVVDVDRLVVGALVDGARPELTPAAPGAAVVTLRGAVVGVDVTHPFGLGVDALPGARLEALTVDGAGAALRVGPSGDDQLPVLLTDVTLVSAGAPLWVTAPVYIDAVGSRVECAGPAGVGADVVADAIVRGLTVRGCGTGVVIGDGESPSVVDLEDFVVEAPGPASFGVVVRSGSFLELRTTSFADVEVTNVRVEASGYLDVGRDDDLGGNTFSRPSGGPALALLGPTFEDVTAWGNVWASGDATVPACGLDIHAEGEGTVIHGGPPLSSCTGPLPRPVTALDGAPAGAFLGWSMKAPAAPFATRAPCDVATPDSGAPARCEVTGALRRLDLGAVACADVTTTDSLGVFRWTCVEDGPETMVAAVGFAPGRGLRELIDWTDPGAPSWRRERVLVRRTSDDAIVAASADLGWYDDAIVVVDDALPLPLAGPTVFAFTTPTPANRAYTGLTLAALVSAPGVVLEGPGVPTLVPAFALTSSTMTWVEVDVNGDRTSAGELNDGALVLRDSAFLVVTGAAVEGSAGDALALERVHQSLVRDTVAANAAYGVRLVDASRNTLLRVAALNSADGFALEGAASARNLIVESLSLQHYVEGVLVDGARDNAFIAVTVGAVESVFETGDGVRLVGGAQGTLLQQVLVANTYGSAVGLDGASTTDNAFVDLAVGWHDGFALASEGGARLTGAGMLRLGTTTTQITPCASSAGAGFDTDCAPDDAVSTQIVIGLPPDDPFSPPPTTDAVHGAVVVNGAAVTTLARFERPWRAWSPVGAAGPVDPAARGHCEVAITCRVLEWALREKAAPSTALAYRQRPAGGPTATLTHAFSDGSVEIVSGRVELLDDVRGNGDGFLSATEPEPVLLLPHLGGYQGEGAIVPTTTPFEYERSALSPP